MALVAAHEQFILCVADAAVGIRLAHAVHGVAQQLHAGRAHAYEGCCFAHGALDGKAFALAGGFAYGRQGQLACELACISAHGIGAGFGADDELARRVAFVRLASAIHLALADEDGTLLHVDERALALGGVDGAVHAVDVGAAS